MFQNMFALSSFVLLVLLLHLVHQSVFGYALSLTRNSLQKLSLHEPINLNEYDENVLKWTKRFVQGIISKSGAGICPYTEDADNAGIPFGTIRYSISSATTVNDAIVDYWREVDVLDDYNDVDLSTTLLIYPHITIFDDFSKFDDFCKNIDAAVEDRELDHKINNVFFHPQFYFKDKDEQVLAIFDASGEIIGFSNEIVAPVSYARRSPWPIVNILRTHMVKSAQKYVPEGKIIAQNTEKLSGIGNDVLQSMLEKRNWNDLLIPSKRSAEGTEPIEDAFQASGFDNVLDTVTEENVTVNETVDLISALHEQEHKDDDALSLEEALQLMRDAEEWASNQYSQ